VSHIFAFYRVL